MYDKICIYDGVSLLDGKTPIIAIWKLYKNNANANKKLGVLFHQTVYIPKFDNVQESVYQNGKDRSVCGNCALRKQSNGVKLCYVSLYQLRYIEQCRKDYLDGKIPLVDISGKEFRKHIYNDTKNFKLRLGEWGDPASIPFEVTDSLCKLYPEVVGYTHQWRNYLFSDLKKYCRASVEDVKSYHIAKNAGWSTARIVVDENQPLLTNEITCLEEVGMKSSCSTCGMCNVGKPKDIVFRLHGMGLKQLKKLQKNEN